MGTFLRFKTDCETNDKLEKLKRLLIDSVGYRPYSTDQMVKARYLVCVCNSGELLRGSGVAWFNEKRVTELPYDEVFAFAKAHADNVKSVVAAEIAAKVDCGDREHLMELMAWLEQYGYSKDPRDSVVSNSCRYLYVSSGRSVYKFGSSAEVFKSNTHTEMSVESFVLHVKSKLGNPRRTCDNLAREFKIGEAGMSERLTISVKAVKNRLEAVVKSRQDMTEKLVDNAVRAATVAVASFVGDMPKTTNIDIQLFAVSNDEFNEQLQKLNEALDLVADEVVAIGDLPVNPLALIANSLQTRDAKVTVNLA